MGFGLLFIGYLFLFNFPLRNYFALDMIPDFVGYVILFFALSKLKLYIDKMRYARLVLIPMLCLAVFRFFFVFLSYFGIYNGTNLINAVWYVENGLIFAFHILLLNVPLYFYAQHLLRWCQNNPRPGSNGYVRLLLSCLLPPFAKII